MRERKNKKLISFLGFRKDRKFGKFLMRTQERICFNFIFPVEKEEESKKKKKKNEVNEDILNYLREISLWDFVLKEITCEL